MLCITYTIAVGLVLGILAHLLEHLRPARVARRWIWCATMAASISLPGYYRLHHSLDVGGAALPITARGIAGGLLGRIGPIDDAISRTWPVATAVLALWAAAGAGWVAYSLRKSRGGRRGAGPSFVGDVAAVITETLGPATVGVWRSRVVLPRWVLALPDTQRDYIVRHEEEHRRSRDCALLFLASLTVILLPWNLALWWQLRRLSLAVEMDCDTRVVAALGDPQSYGSMLLTVAQASGGPSRLQPGLLGAAGMLERRLVALLAPATPHRAHRVLMAVAACLLLVAVLSTPHPVAGHAHSRAARGPSSVAAR
ncbi:MAG TPA: M56 family metallopeptidase [Gemmatimonadaceae bacterium]|nr:M56 family metallopeptidase [Gemmatimonadaceae bacterium]